MAWNFFFWDEIFFCDRKCLSVTGNFFLWQEILSSERNFVQWMKFIPMAWNFVFWDENSFCDRKFLRVTGNFFLWHEISSCDRKFLLSQEISFCHRKFIPETGNFFLRHKVSYPKFFPGQDFWNILSFLYKIKTSLWILFKTSPENSRLPAKILGTLAAKIRPCNLLTSCSQRAQTLLAT